MSAICGVIHRGGASLDPGAVDVVMRRLSIYGPDGRGVWQRGSAALGYQHRQITPEARYENQPVERNGLVLVADLRLDNRDELASKLGLRATDLPTMPDSAMLLSAYERWGEECVQHLVGDFAFALWDERNRRLFCARDHFGLRLFYFYAGADYLAFATSERALLDLPYVPATLNDRTIAEYVAARPPSDLSATFFTNIQRLPPAHTLTVSHGELRIRRYWEADLTREIIFRRDEDYVAAYRDHFERAVRDRMRTTHGVACGLSGGLDSSAITVVAARELERTGRPRLATYSHVRALEHYVPNGDERSLMEAVIGMTPHVDASFITTAGKSMARAMLQPPHDHTVPFVPSLMLTEALSHAKQRGVRVMLGGYGGDHIATSRSMLGLHELLVTGRWLTLSRIARARARNTNQPVHRILGNTVAGVLETRMLWVGSLRRSISPSRTATANALENTFLADTARQFVPAEQLGTDERERDPIRRLREYHWRAVAAPALEGVLARTQLVPDFFQIEFALPMLDRRLIEYCLAVPCEQHVGAHSRWLMRRAMDGLLPNAVRLRTDKSHSANPSPLEFTIGDQEALAHIFDSLDGEPLVREFVDLKRLRHFVCTELPSRSKQDRHLPSRLPAIGRAVNAAVFLAWSARRTASPTEADR